MKITRKPEPKRSSHKNSKPYNSSGGLDVTTDAKNGDIDGITYDELCGKYKLHRDIFWPYTPSQDAFINLLPNETFDGCEFTISALTNEGLFNIDVSVTSLENAPKVKKLNVSSDVSENNTGGGIIRGGNEYFIVCHCRHIGPIDQYAGGIVGWECNDFIVSECHSEGSIGQYGGGIVGYGSYNGIIEDCTSKGAIFYCGGGIVGYDCYDMVIRKCKSYGNIGQYGGGITGYECYQDSAVFTIDQCKSVGYISAYAGGIVGDECSGINISNCYSKGGVGFSAGGILGYECSGCTVYACYSRGSLEDSAGGIVGDDSSNCAVSDCYVLGQIGINSGSNVGGIYAHLNELSIATNTYTIGLIGETDCGGMCGGFSSNITGNNFYSIGPETTIGTGFAPPSATGNVETNCYTVNPVDGQLNTSLLISSLDNLPSGNWTAVTGSYPILNVFKSSPWKKYNRYNQHPKLKNL